MKKPTPFGKYYLLERINVGGMAEVFRAKAFGVEGFERLVAVKRILPNIAEDKEFIRMFIEEAKLAVQLNHANIAQIFDLGVVDGAYYIALEHVHGRDLRGMFDRCRLIGEPMPVSQACFTVMKVCEGLDYAHNKRDQSGRELHLVHRDVSPQNILVSFEGEVKLIDFGIAKAAGKGSKTQAGILKGKFGYMSPEQVRGIPIDRRSDVFSCGIVLYELLTGERLFVGESDFSTLEKVRNVEILPPSTYNRRIPDELERIVLKALAKDVEDRYQNAIDLHDELQAFVYTAGEFYSRKDLAGWMKKTFGKEIEEETAKLESYRQLKAPTEPPPGAPAIGRTPTAGSAPISRPPSSQPPPPRKSTQALPAVKSTTMPPPPPSASMRMSAQQPAVQAAAPARAESGLSWDDDELETQIYDDPADDPKRRPGGPGAGISKPLPLSAPSSGPPPMGAASSGPIDNGPDLSSLVSTARGWDNSRLPPPHNGANGLAGPNGAANAPTMIEPPRISAAGSQKGPVPAHYEDPAAALVASLAQPRESSAPVRLVSQPPAPMMYPSAFEEQPMFGSSAAHRRQQKKRTMTIAIIAAALVVLTVVIVIAVTSGGNKPTTMTAATAGTAPAQPPGSAAPAEPPRVAGDDKTGFDLYVTPSTVKGWKLDGVEQQINVPARIRDIAPGVHTIAIDAPIGFMSANKTVSVELSQASKVEITLDAISVTGHFDSNPQGATVSLIVDGKRQLLGPSPQQATLDPRKTYAVLFEKPGAVSINRPISFSGAPDEKITVDLEAAGAPPTAGTPPIAATGPVTQPTHANPPHTNSAGTPPQHPTVATNPLRTNQPEHKAVTETPPKTDGGVATNEHNEHPADTVPKMGVLRLNSKPPCNIHVDGKDTGLQTPQRAYAIPVGVHKITLINNEFGIKETYSVDIHADPPAILIKDYSDRLPK